MKEHKGNSVIMELQLDVLQYEQMVERRDEKIKRLKDIIKTQDGDDRSKFLCWHCKSELIWGGDHDTNELSGPWMALEENNEGIISNFSCSNYDCNTHVEVFHFFSPEK
jgi:hypothetical protein|tara:strand:+ start:211 stop:537 length:327 start_codon:yes stop_codon:yes gene_type:complete